jgi:hypothetical protein
MLADVSALAFMMHCVLRQILRQRKIWHRSNNGPWLNAAPDISEHFWLCRLVLSRSSAQCLHRQGITAYEPLALNITN